MEAGVAEEPTTYTIELRAFLENYPSTEATASFSVVVEPCKVASIVAGLVPDD